MVSTEKETLDLSSASGRIENKILETETAQINTFPDSEADGARGSGHHKADKKDKHEMNNEMASVQLSQYQ